MGEFPPIPYRLIRQPAGNVYCQAFCRWVAARDYAPKRGYHHAFMLYTRVSVATTTARYSTLAAGTHNAHTQSASPCN